MTLPTKRPTTKWEAFICDRCGHHGELQDPPATLEAGWTCLPNYDEFGHLYLCPSCKPAEANRG